MESLFVYNENIINTLNIEILDILSLISILCGVLVILTNNPVISVLFLIGLFASISGYLMMVGIHFIGLAYLLVYVGAVSILFLFILMLINVRISELVSNSKSSLLLSGEVVIIFNYAIYSIIPSDYTIIDYYIFNIYKIFNKFIYNNAHSYNINSNNTAYLINKFNNDDLNFALSKVWDGNLIEINHIGGIGNIMYTNYSIWLIITSIILLLAMIGVIVITIKSTR